MGTARGQDLAAVGERDAGAALEAAFRDPPAAARPWTFWYWMDAAVSREGITADLEAMKAAGLGGAYLMPIKGPTTPPRIDPPAVQLSPVWWEMVRHAISESDRLGLELAMHVCDGFATAGGPWITPELSMQRLVWSRAEVDGGESGRLVDAQLSQPAPREGYYRDVAVLAFPAPEGAGVSSRTVTPQVVTSEAGFDGAFLARGLSEDERAKPQAAEVRPQAAPRWRSEGAGWIEYAFDEPFTARSMTVWPEGANYSSLRLRVEARDESGAWRPVEQLEAPRHGWQEGELPWTYALPPTTSTAFRFVFDPAGSEPGAEDLDSAKWKPVLKIRGLELSSEARIHQFEGKSGAAWRVAKRTTTEAVPAELCISREKIVDVSKHLDDAGRLSWSAPAGKWTVLRLGHTSTGKRNETAGGGKGLECDKFSAAAARLQYDSWFGEIRRQAGQELAERVIKGFHVDSWECGAQNWTAEFPAEFRARRGYDPLPWLPAMAGVPVESGEASERFLHDVRTTIAELVVDRFYGTLAELAHADGCWFSAECTSPTFVGDGMAHFAKVDIPMGEFWLRSPTHDKPNDMLDAISAAHIYGKPIIQAEAFTELRLAWDESPRTLKKLGDRHFALGANRLVTHVFAHNPWLDRKPGMTLSGIGTYLQRDQTWWPMARGWTDYLARCQAMLQFGSPVVDIAVFTGEEVPRRAVVPWQLTGALPGVLGERAVEGERRRIANEGQRQRSMPPGVTASARIPALSWDEERSMAGLAANCADPLQGYAYDSINRDALLRLAEVRDGRIVLPGGASYALLVVPGPRALNPNAHHTSPEVLQKLVALAEDGARIVIETLPTTSIGATEANDLNGEVRRLAERLNAFGPERVAIGPITSDLLRIFGLRPDLRGEWGDFYPADFLAWNHRAGAGIDVYFVSHQSGELTSDVQLFPRDVEGRQVEYWNPLTGEIFDHWRPELDGIDSVFVVVRQSRGNGENGTPAFLRWKTLADLDSGWHVTFGSKQAPTLRRQMNVGSWAESTEDDVKYFSGVATYETSFEWRPDTPPAGRIWLDLAHRDFGRVADMAEVTLNGKPCGIVWSRPYRVDVTSALQLGENRLEVAVANTWQNRLVREAQRPEDERTAWSTAPFPPTDTPLREAGLLGPVRLVELAK